MSAQLPQTFPVSSHTDHVGPGSTYVAINGTKHNGLTYIPLALSKGATTIVVQYDDHVAPEVTAQIEVAGAKLERVENARKAVALMSAHALNYPARRLKIIGITGTKGKTTSSHILEYVMNQAGYRTALLSTVGNRINGESIPGSLTTPLPDYLQMFLHSCIAQQVDVVIMEVSAQALTLYRIIDILFDGIIFTNFSQEHAEFYPNIDDYFHAKCLIFDHLKFEAPLIINTNDQWLNTIASRFPQAITFSQDSSSNYCLDSFKTDLVHGSTGTIKHKDQTIEFHSPLVGLFNGYNILGATALMHELGISWNQILYGLGTFSRVPGRLEKFPLPNGAFGCIDYAHNPSSFDAILSLLTSLSPHVIVVFGCGGDRDHNKRPEMGRIAAYYATHVILTTDNPRSENPADIIEQIAFGIPPEHNDKIHRQLDRKRAIELAYQLSNSESIIALLGKGPDEYQLSNGIKAPFSERKILAMLR